MKSFWKMKAFLLLLLFVSSVFSVGQKTSADTIYGGSDIGKYQTTSTSGGSVTESVVGVRVRIKQSSGIKTALCGVDTWKKKGSGSWEYVGSDLDGVKGQYASHRLTGSSLHFLGATTPRFGLIAGSLKTHTTDFPKEYSLVTEKFSQGRKTEQYAEYSFQSQTELGQRKDSFMHQLVGNGEIIEIGSYSGDGTSYDFTIYPAISIQQGETVSVNTGECTLSKAGKAFYNGGYYYIKELPQVTPPTGYSITIDGWYDDKESGRKFQEGDLISPNKTLYLRYKLTANEYTVNCLDMIGSQSGLQLGSSQWKQTYGTTASGSQAGAIPLADTYYQGMYYTGCTTAVVGVQGATVYRFFQYASYPVTIVDMVNTGKQSGKTLGTNQKQCTYQQVVEGGSLMGSSAAEGTYYTGYVYNGQSSSRVEIGGTTVYRYFKPIIYTVRFDGNGAVQGRMDSLTGCEYGYTYSLPPNAYYNMVNVKFDLQSEEAVFGMGNIQLKRDFKGWSTYAGGSALYNEGASIQNLSNVSGESTLYAVWEKAELILDTQPKRMGYQFAGWSERADAAQGDSILYLTQDTTLYAIWKPDVTRYHVEYYKEKLDGLFEKAAEYTFNDYSGKEITLENIEQLYPGFYVDTSSSVLSGTIRGDGSLILSVYYRRNTYTVQFDLDGGTAKQDYPELSGIYESDVEIPKEIPQREHYQFAGWTADKGSGQIYCRPGDTYHIPNHNQTLYAVWEPDRYQVHYMMAPEQEEVLVRQEYAFYEDINLPECEAAKKGYRFAGWKCDINDSICYAAGETMASRFEVKDGIVKFYAVWKPISGTVVFRKNAPEEESAVMGTMPVLEYEYDAPCSLSEKTYFTAGYDFLGWNTEPDGSGQSFAAGESIKNAFDTEGENCLYAQWGPSPDTNFVLQLFKETLSGEKTEDGEFIRLKGETNQSVANAVLNYYHKDTMEEVFQGFVVDNPEAMDETVRSDGSTIVTLYLSRREYTVTIAENFQAETYFSRIKCRFEDSVILDEQLETVGSVARYVDREGRGFYPGEVMKVLGNVTLVPQHKVCYRLDDIVAEEHYVNHNGAETAYRPTEKAYRFDGWYIDGGNGDRYCGAGDRIHIKKDLSLTGKWSQEKITYQIGYEMGSYDGVVALEVFAKAYQYGDCIVLPTKAQIYIPEKYGFVGWYEQGDSSRKIVAKIPEEAYGDKMYCLLLEEHASSGNTPELSDSASSENLNGSGDKNSSGGIGDTDADGDDNNKENADGHSKEDGKDGDTKQDGFDEGSASSSSDIPSENPNGGSQSMVSPITGSTKRGDGNSQTALSQKNCFTKKKIQYRILSGKKNQVVVIGANPSLRTVKIPAKVKWNHKTYTVTKIGKKAFYAHPALRKITIGKQVKIIGKQAFAHTAKLQKVILGKNVTIIKSKAFFKSRLLQKVTVKGKHMKRVGKKAFGKIKGHVKFSVPSSCEKKYRKIWKNSGVKAEWKLKK